MPYSKQDLIEAGIPLDVTIDMLYQEKKLGNLTSLPRASMCNTIRSKYPEITTLEDLFTKAPQGKVFQEFQKGILEAKNTICAIYDRWTKIITIPSSLKEPLTLENGLRAFISEYLRQKEEYAVLSGYQVNAVKHYCKVLKMYFDEQSRDNVPTTIAASLGRSTQNIYDQIDKARFELNNLLFIDGFTIDNMQVDPRLSSLVQSFNSQFVGSGTDEELATRSGIQSPRIRLLLSTILGFKILETGTIITRGDTVGHELDLKKGTVKKLLKIEGIPVSFDDFKILLQKNFTDEELKQNLELFVQNNHEFEVFEKNDREYIAIKWMYLGNIENELLRILYDNDAWTVRSAMSSEDLKREWNKRRASIPNVKEKKYLPHYHHWRFCPLAKSGYFKLKWNEDDFFLDGQRYVAKLIYENPKWLFDTILDQAKNDGYTSIYSKRSLRAYYTNAIADNHVENALREAIKILDYSDSNTLSFKELSKEVKGKNVNIQDPALARWLRKNDDVFKVFKNPGGKALYVKLINNRGELITKKEVLKATSHEQENVNGVSTTDNVPNINWDETSQFIHTQISEIQTYSLNNGVENMFTIMKEGQDDLRNDSVFRTWLPDLPHSNTMTSWSKDNFRMCLVGSVEAFISLLYRMRYNSDIKSDIRNDFNYDGKPIGLSSMISFLKKKHLLPENGDYMRGSVQNMALDVSKKVVKARNELSHRYEATVNLADNIMSAQIHDTLLFFIYLASRLD